MNNDTPKIKCDFIVVGAGPAGIMAAIAAAKRGLSVIVLERNGMIGRKLRITGKGRCNITNNCDFDTLIENIPGNGRFLYSALRSFDNFDVIDFFNNAGLKTVDERGGRIFPASQKASDVAEILKNEAKKYGVSVRYGMKVKELMTEENDGIKAVCGVVCEENDMRFYSQNVLIATGGKSYPLTGSSGDGYIWAEKIGHTIVTPKPSLCALECSEKWISELEGLSLKNVVFKLCDGNGKQLFSDFGEMLFTNKGVSGPIVLSSSRFAALNDFKKLTAYIDFKPALSIDKLEERLIRDFEKYNKKQISNAFCDLLPSRLIPIVIKCTGLNPCDKVYTITKVQRRTIAEILKNFKLHIKGSAPFSEAIITMGGIKTSEINPKSMESKLCKGLYFAGEVIDVDGYTGGFNLTIAFSTGHAAGMNIKKTV
ncbi:MAG: NAD(P)/FAD-dependent oxidoreductase [Clostridia bacterium]|nr:NAD(P)/FAD-dependent oxidoreductase [Clostridia bacterium]